MPTFEILFDDQALSDLEALRRMDQATIVAAIVWKKGRKTLKEAADGERH